jgi:hypothetical protein
MCRLRKIVSQEKVSTTSPMRSRSSFTIVEVNSLISFRMTYDHALHNTESAKNITPLNI